MMTTVLPDSAVSLTSFRSSSVRSPAVFSFSRTARLRGWRKNSYTLCAITGPMPSTALTSSSVADSRASSVEKWFAS